MTGKGLLNNWGLSARIVALSLLLLLLIQAAVFSVVRASIDQSARQQIAQELQVGERVWRRLLDQNALKLAQGAGLLAADFGFRAAVSTGDVDTIRSALANQGARIGATVTALIDNNLNLTAVGQGQDAQLRAASFKLQANLPALVACAACRADCNPRPGAVPVCDGAGAGTHAHRLGIDGFSDGPEFAG